MNLRMHLVMFLLKNLSESVFSTYMFRRMLRLCFIPKKFKEKKNIKGSDFLMFGYLIKSFK